MCMNAMPLTTTHQSQYQNQLHPPRPILTRPEYVVRFVAKAPSVTMFSPRCRGLLTEYSTLFATASRQHTMTQTQAFTSTLTQRRHPKRQHHVRAPVPRCAQPHGLGPDLAGEDFSRVRPARRAPSGGKGRDEQVRAGDYDDARGPVALDQPRYLVVGRGPQLRVVVSPKVLLDRAADEEQRHHDE